MAPAQPPALRNRVRRAFSHADMKNVCEQFRRGNIGNLPGPTQALIDPPLPIDLVIIADTLVELQEAVTLQIMMQENSSRDRMFLPRSHSSTKLSTYRDCFVAPLLAMTDIWDVIASEAKQSR